MEMVSFIRHEQETPVIGESPLREEIHALSVLLVDGLSGLEISEETRTHVSTVRAVLLLRSLDSYRNRPSSDAAGCCVLGEGCSGVS
jgi:hypothetical protein